MIKTRCTHCQASMDAPDAYVGRSAKCRKCGKKFVIQDETPSIEFQAADPEEFAESVRPPASYGLREPSGPVAATANRPAAPTAAAEWAALNGSGSDSSEHRYPNLLKYFAWGRALSRVVLLLAIVGAAIVFVTGMYSVYRLIAAELIGFWESVFYFFTVSLSTGCILVAGYIFFVVTMAAIEFMRVVVDIEANTRRSR